MTIWPFKWRVVGAHALWCAGAFAWVSCSGQHEASAEISADWLETAQHDLSQPRQVLYESVSSRGTQQSGRIFFQDATHFRVETILVMASTTPDGAVEQITVPVTSASDGENLRIQLPAIYGSPASVAVFPVQRFAELASVSPTSSLHRFRPESLNPILLAQALLRGCDSAEQLVEQPDDHTQHFTAALPTELLLALGLVDPSERNLAFSVHFELAEASGKFSALQIVAGNSESTRYTLRFDDCPAATLMNAEGFSLTIPEGFVIVDLSQQLTH